MEAEERKTTLWFRLEQPVGTKVCVRSVNTGEVLTNSKNEPRWFKDRDVALKYLTSHVLKEREFFGVIDTDDEIAIFEREDDDIKC